MIKAMFFSRFLTTEGPKVLHQVPDGAIVPSAGAPNQIPLFEFDQISSFLIPRQEFCDRLVTITASRHRILGYPVCIANRKYARNEFMFNFAIVLEEDKDFSSYATVVRKLAKLFRSLEEQGDFLSQELGDDGYGHRGKIYALCEIILEDLNNYCECMIPVDDSNTINIKLFPLYPPPPPVKPWHVPLSTVRLESLMDENWDLTMQKIVPYIDGINTVRRISEYADADYTLVKKCIEHLLYYRTLLLLPPHHFSAIFAPTSDLRLFLSDASMQAECASYVSTSPEGTPVEIARLIALYPSLRQGQALKQWYIEQGRDGRLEGIDIRRFITFGLIKGLIYRVHKYVMRGGGGGGGGSVGGQLLAETDAVEAVGRSASNLSLHKRSSQRRGTTAPYDSARPQSSTYVDGTHALDEICTDLQASEREVLAKLKSGVVTPYAQMDGRLRRSKSTVKEPAMDDIGAIEDVGDTGLTEQGSGDLFIVHR